jgi:hypothetical protein
MLNNLNAFKWENCKFNAKSGVISILAQYFFTKQEVWQVKIEKTLIVLRKI